MTDEKPTEPALVNVANEEPIAVKVEDSDPVSVKVAREVEATRNTATDKTLAAAKVEADKLRTADQRRVSGVWERTQQLVALSVVWDALVVVAVLTLLPGLLLLRGVQVPEWAITAAVAGLLFLTGIANLVIGFYFGRTNHQKVGGDPGEVVGR